MRVFLFCCLALAFYQCQTEPVSEEVTGNLMEIAPDQLELDEIALLEQPETVQDFFKVKTELIGDEFCYDYNSVSQLILHGNANSETWKKFELSNNYLTVYNSDCNVLLEFMTFELNGEKKAFLSQMNGNVQQFDYLSWNPRTERWIKINRFPTPQMSDYFANLSPEETKLVHDYGSDYIYINPNTKDATFVFSEWSMLMNMGEKQELEFDETPDYYFELGTRGTSLTLTKIATHPVMESAIDKDSLSVEALKFD